MPSSTPRGYPYPLPADLADVPQALEDLALAVDGDVNAVAQTISARPAFRLAGTIGRALPLIVPSPSGFDSVQLSFDRVDAVTGGALVPLTGPTNAIVPALPGFWWIQVIANFPRANGANINDFGLSLETATETIVRANTHVLPPASDGANNLVCTTGRFFNGTTDYVRARFNINKTAVTLGSYVVGPRYMFAVRMTES